jgi:arsenite methyltransferase
MLGTTSVEALAADPWRLLRRVLDGPLHPGGADATRELLDRADVGPGTRLVDLGCGEGGAVALASDRGSMAVGLDREPAGVCGAGDGLPGMRGAIGTLPIRDDAVDVALAECVLCLADDLDRALAESRRILHDDGRLALSDIVVTGDLDAVPPSLQRAFCLTGPRDAAGLADRVTAAGYAVRETCDHHEDLLAMRDRLQSRVDYERLLGALGNGGDRLLSGVRAIETAVEDERIGYVSLVADAA